MALHYYLAYKMKDLDNPNGEVKLRETILPTADILIEKLRTVHRINADEELSRRKRGLRASIVPVCSEITVRALVLTSVPDDVSYKMRVAERQAYWELNSYHKKERRDKEVAAAERAYSENPKAYATLVHDDPIEGSLMPPEDTK